MMRKAEALSLVLLLLLLAVPLSVDASYAEGSKLSIPIACPTTPATDPTFTFTLTNLGSKPVEVSTEEPISLMVHLTVTDAQWKLIQPGYFDSGMRSLTKPRILEPGKSFALMDWIRHDKPQTAIIPLRAFGYSLAPGVYDIWAKATNDPAEAPSNHCRVTIAATSTQH
jgi:hypothetical protein